MLQLVAALRGPWEAASGATLEVRLEGRTGGHLEWRAELVDTWNGGQNRRMQYGKGFSSLDIYLYKQSRHVKHRQLADLT